MCPDWESNPSLLVCAVVLQPTESNRPGLFVPAYKRMVNHLYYVYVLCIMLNTVLALKISELGALNLKKNKLLKGLYIRKQQIHLWELLKNNYRVVLIRYTFM